MAKTSALHSALTRRERQIMDILYRRGVRLLRLSNATPVGVPDGAA